MAGVPHGSEQRPVSEEVARDLAAIEERLKSAQAELDAVTKERREALERLGRLHAERVAEDRGERDDGGEDEPGEPVTPN
jgi:seryl-tRNA synthetase